MKKIIVLGAGLIGKEAAKDLSSRHEVTAADRVGDALVRAFSGVDVRTIQVDLTDPGAVRRVVEPFDLVVGALPGFLGRGALEEVIRAGKDVVDIAFFPEDPLELDNLALESGVTAIVDFGLAPGMSNCLLGFHAAGMKRVDRFECLVGGLPRDRECPFEYKAVFSPRDVIEEYTRPARLVEKGEVVVRPALSEVERVRFEGVGELEAFNTDGLRTLLHTMRVPEMREKTLRYPGHASHMRSMREAGFFSTEPIELSGASVTPLDFTTRLLFPAWKLGPGEEDLTVMRVTVQGIGEHGKAETVVYDLLDRYDTEGGVTSMARTTGYACAAAVELLARGLFARKGVCPPEIVGAQAGCLDFILSHLHERGVVYRKTVTRDKPDS